MNYSLLLPPVIGVLAIALLRGKIRNHTYCLWGGAVLCASAAIQVNEGFAWFDTGAPLVTGVSLIFLGVRRRPRPRPLDGSHEAIR